ncbi:MAG: EamA family transporter [Actinocatenispora sp.]
MHPLAGPSGAVVDPSFTVTRAGWPRSSGSGAGAVVAAAVLWGSTGTAAWYAPSGVDPVLVGSAGLVLGGALLAVTAGRGSLQPWRAGHRLLTLTGALAVAAYPLSFYLAVHRAGIAMGTIVMLGCSPAFAGLLTVLVERRHPGRRWFTATVSCVVGGLILVLGGGGSAVADPLGLALAALAGLSYATYSVVAGLLIRRGIASRSTIGGLFGGAAALLLAVQLVAGVGWLAEPRSAVVVGWLAVVCTFTAYLLYGYGLRSTSAATATTLALAEPAVATVLGVTVAGERMSTLAWVGLAPLAAGLVVLALPVRRQSPTAR